MGMWNRHGRREERPPWDNGFHWRALNRDDTKFLHGANHLTTGAMDRTERRNWEQRDPQETHDAYHTKGKWWIEKDGHGGVRFISSSSCGWVKWLLAIVTLVGFYGL